jgi:hypothetical protein
MENFERTPATAFGGSGIATAERATAFLRTVYGWMCAGLAITALVAYSIASSPGLVQALVTNHLLFLGLFIAQIALVFFLSARVDRLAPGTATLLFIAYAALTGVTLSVLALAYTGASIATTFVVTAGMFGALALYGSTTRRSLAGVGQFVFMGLLPRGAEGLATGVAIAGCVYSLTSLPSPDGGHVWTVAGLFGSSRSPGWRYCRRPPAVAARPGSAAARCAKRPGERTRTGPVSPPLAPGPLRRCAGPTGALTSPVGTTARWRERGSRNAVLSGRNPPRSATPPRRLLLPAAGYQHRQHAEHDRREPPCVLGVSQLRHAVLPRLSLPAARWMFQRADCCRPKELRSR